MSIVGCGIILEGPVPKPNKFGLLSALDGGIQTMVDAHQQAGFQVEDIYCSELSSTLSGCDLNVPVSGVTPKTADDGPSYCCSDPFTVYSSFRCSPAGFTLDRVYDIVQKRYDAGIERAVEKIFWTGITPAGNVKPSLAFGNPTCGLVPVDITPTGGAVSPTAGLAALEQAMSTCWPGESIIHMNSGVLSFLADRARLVDTGKELYTYAGNRVVAGDGYQTSGPGNILAPTGQAWMFATSQVLGWRTEPFFSPPKPDSRSAVNRANNDVIVRLEATWGLSFVCCIYAIRVTLCDCNCS